jgi:hypothetical protein
MKRCPSPIAALVVGFTVAVMCAAGPRADPKPLLQIGSQYVFLMPGEVKRTAEAVEDLGEGWYRMRYKHSDGVARMIWLNLNQVVYFQPAEAL